MLVKLGIVTGSRRRSHRADEAWRDWVDSLPAVDQQCSGRMKRATETPDSISDGEGRLLVSCNCMSWHKLLVLIIKMADSDSSDFLKD